MIQISAQCTLADPIIISRLKPRMHLIALAGLVLTLSSPAIAQENPTVGQSNQNELDAPAQNDAANICLSNTVKGGELKDREVTIAVPAQNVADFVKRGFTPSPCKSFAAADTTEICRLAEARDFAVNEWFRLNIGFTPKERCEVIGAAAF